MSQTLPWDERFGGSDYFYGTEPNDFLAENVHLLQGPVLSLAEGEGRNAVFMASQGLDVLGVDSSAVGLEKARQLALARGVSIHTQVLDLADFNPRSAYYGGVVSIFAHLPAALRQRLNPRLEQALAPGGLLLLEAYSERQMTRDTGGPKNLDMLMTVDKIRAEFPGLQIELLHEIERDVREGRGHTGPASVVQFMGRKPV